MQGGSNSPHPLVWWSQRGDTGPPVPLGCVGFWRSPHGGCISLLPQHCRGTIQAHMTGQTVTYRSYLAAICCVNRCTVSLAGRPATTGTHAHMSRLAPPHSYPAPDMASPISPTAREHHQGEQASWGGPGGTRVFRRNCEGSSSRTSPAGPVSSAPLGCWRQQQRHNACTSQWVRGNRVLLPVSPFCHPSQQVAI